jgi:anaerobic selenocysteine-containing dehydrogenase
MVVLMNKADMEEHGLKDCDEIDLFGAAGDAVPRAVRGLRVVTYDVPQGSCAGYYPECNPLLPLWHHAEGSHVPAAKSIARPKAWLNQRRGTIEPPALTTPLPGQQENSPNIFTRLRPQRKHVWWG